MTHKKRCWVLSGVLAMVMAPAAWGFAALGHQTVGDGAARLIQGSRAEHEVQRILGSRTLGEMSVWSDCAKGIDPGQDFRYTVRGRYAECAPFENDAEEAVLADHVRRNLDACRPAPGEESCHKQYHYTNMSLMHTTYQRGRAGTSDHDLLAAIDAAIARLQGREVPAPFSLVSEREALSLLVHTIGDLHQPLHVAQHYLDAQGRPINPDEGTDDPLSRTVGGNALIVVGPKGPGGNLHAWWDGAPYKLDAARKAALPGLMAAVPETPGDWREWPRVWATESMAAARLAHEGLEISSRQASLRGSRWMVHLPADYDARTADITQQQLARGAAHLAQLLRKIWP